MYTFLLILAAILLYLAIAIRLSRTQRPRRAHVSFGTRGKNLSPAVGRELTVSTWNLGYAGLGADSDFVADRGKHLFPPSRAATRRNLDGILAMASELKSDIAFYQEVSDASPLSFWAPLDRRLRHLHSDKLYLFQRDIATRLLVWPLRICHGLVMATSIRPQAVETIPLPLEPAPTMGLIRRQYALQLARLSGSGGQAGWSVINLHLSAFDEGNLRQDQLRAAINLAAAEYAMGRHVVMGGDWNLALVARELSSAEEAHALFWLRPFPREILPEGWRIATPAESPTVRTNHQPYVAGVNPTATIDGFLVSPNVEIVSVAARNTGFLMSDHQPVLARFRSRGNTPETSSTAIST